MQLLKQTLSHSIIDKKKGIQSIYLVPERNRAPLDSRTPVRSLQLHLLHESTAHQEVTQARSNPLQAGAHGSTLANVKHAPARPIDPHNVEKPSPLFLFGAARPN